MDRSATISLAVDPALIEAARNKGVDLATLFERALRRELVDSELNEAASPNWPRENEAAIRSMNEYVEKHGLLSDHYRLD